MTTKPFDDVTGYILCGGKSSRMGFDKSRLKLAGGGSLLENTILLLESVLGEKPVLTGDNIQGDISEDCRIISDKVPNKGPLGGLTALLEDCETEWAMAAAVDLPYLSEDDVLLLLSAERGNLDVLTLTVDGQIEPVAALYRKSSQSFWQTRLDRNQLELQPGIKQLRWNVVYLPDGSAGLTNINRIEDFREDND